MHNISSQVFLIILDGWGWSPIPHGNLLAETATPNLDTLLALGNWTMLKTASLEVGLPWGSVGDSELGHYNMGTGRVMLRRDNDGHEDFIQLTERAMAITETPYYKLSLGVPLRGMADRPTISLGTILAGYGLTQAKIAVTEKLSLLTHAMNGYPSLPLPGEMSFVLRQEDRLGDNLAAQKELMAQALIVINLSAADIAAHRGDLAAVRQAITLIDHQLQDIFELARAKQAVIYLAADHGNIEQMLTEHDQILPGHTTAPVVFARIDARRRQAAIHWASHEQRKAEIALSTPSGLLADVGPTILEEFGLPTPNSMVGLSLRRTLIGRE